MLNLKNTVAYNTNFNDIPYHNQAYCGLQQYYQLYDVPMKFACKLIHGGQCSF